MPFEVAVLRGLLYFMYYKAVCQRVWFLSQFGLKLVTVLGSKMGYVLL